MRDGGEEERAPYSPSGYHLDETSERPFLILGADDGGELARSSGTGASREEIEKQAQEDFPSVR